MSDQNFIPPVPPCGIAPEKPTESNLGKYDKLMLIFSIICFTFNLAANPATYFDQQGDSVAVLHYFEHVGMLIQNRSGQWEYFSVNGIPISEVTGGFSGRSYNCKGERAWPSVDAFMSDTNYNRPSNDPDDTSVSGMVYTDYVVLPTTAQQDDLIRESMMNSCNSNYIFVSKNCATAVYTALKSGNALPREFLMMQGLLEKFDSDEVPISTYATQVIPSTLFYGLKSSMYIDNKISQCKDFILNWFNNSPLKIK